MTEIIPQYIIDLKKDLRRDLKSDIVDELKVYIDTRLKDTVTTIEKVMHEAIGKAIDELAISIAGHFTFIYKRLDEMDERFNAVDDRLDKIEWEISNMKVSIEKIEGHIGRYEIRAQNIEQILLQDFGPRIKDIEKTVFA